METWFPTGDPREQFAPSHEILHADLATLSLQIEALHHKADLLDGGTPHARKNTPRGRKYVVWRNTLNADEHALLSVNGYAVPAEEPEHNVLVAMKELVRTARNIESANKSRARARQSSTRYARFVRFLRTRSL